MVCGAIHRAAGSELEAACRKIGRIDPGQAVLTEAFNLPADYVIHAVAPRYLDGSRGELEVLAETYKAICRLSEMMTALETRAGDLGRLLMMLR